MIKYDLLLNDMKSNIKFGTDSAERAETLQRLSETLRSLDTKVDFSDKVLVASAMDLFSKNKLKGNETSELANNITFFLMDRVIDARFKTLEYAVIDSHAYKSRTQRELTAVVSQIADCKTNGIEVYDGRCLQISKNTLGQRQITISPAMTFSGY